MLRLFEVSEDYKLQLNKEWILMVPEFAAIVARDRGSVGDAQGRAKKRALRELSFVYLMEDFLSPYREENEYNRRIVVLKTLELKETDIDSLIEKAQMKYRELLYSNAPSLKTLQIVRASREKLEEYFEEIDLTATNARGDLIYNATTYINNIKQLPPMEEAITEYEKLVYSQLLNETGIRGKAVKGFNEGKTRELREGGGTIDNGPSLLGMFVVPGKDVSKPPKEDIA
jgi:hypothetical protein